MNQDILESYNEDVALSKLIINKIYNTEKQCGREVAIECLARIMQYLDIPNPRSNDEENYWYIDYILGAIFNHK